MHNIILNKKLVDDYVSVSDYLIGMGAMFFEQYAKIHIVPAWRKRARPHRLCQYG